MGARLMEVHTSEDYERALRFHEIMEIGFWLGGNDKNEEGNWVWISNEEKIKRNEFWSSNCPTRNLTRNCLVMGSGGMWAYRCSDKRKSVCIFD